MSTHAQGKESHTILLGGLGGDSHSVGLTILRQALSANGYRVHYLGTQNRLDDFFQLAGLCNVVMISSMDGHAQYYLRHFPELRKQHNGRETLWYLGGNLHIGEGNGCERQLVEMGFNRVFAKFVDLENVLDVLVQDLNGTKAVPDCPALWERLRPVNPYLAGTASDTPLELDTFERSRREVLQYWTTGRKAKNLQENGEFLCAQPSFPRVQALVNSGQSQILVQPRSGVPTIEEQIKLFKTFKSLGVQVLSYQVDSFTRNNNYAGAEEAIRESRSSGVSTLNGFPVVNHGVAGLRQIAREVKVPLQVRHSTRDPRLLAEISYAGGATSFEGGAICYNIPYYKDYPLAESLNCWRYVDCLTGRYHEELGIILDREFFGTLTATLIPPCLAIAVDVIEALLAVRQGVKCVSLGYAEQGHRIQDIAAIRTLDQVAKDLFRNLGYKEIQVNTVFHQYMAAFPPSGERSAHLICNSAITAALSRATRVIGKTPAEAHRIPTLTDNIAGIDLINRGISMAAETHVDEARVAEECSLVRREVEAIIESVIFCGGGDLAQGIISAFEKGFLDIPFSPSIYNRGEVMTARDVEGAVRFLSTGNLQFDRDLREFHQDKMGERRRAEGLCSAKQNYLLIEKDVMQVARNQYHDWPLFQ